MQAHRAHAPHIRRIGVALSVAAVLSVGLTHQGTASAADVTAFPQDLSFQPVGIAATADDVFAVGAVDAGDDMVDMEAFVEEVGSGDRVSLGPDTRPTSVSTADDGAILSVLGSHMDDASPGSATDNVLWTVVRDGAGMLTVSEQVIATDRFPVAVLGGPDGASLVGTDGSGHGALWRADGQVVDLGAGVQPYRAGVVSTVDGDAVVVAGNDWLDDGTGQATLRVVAASGTVSAPVVLGPADDPHQGVVAMAVDGAGGLAYAVSMQDDPEGGPQQYGLNVVDTTGAGHVQAYVPLESPVFSLGLSPDARTLYAGATGLSAYDVDRIGSYTADDPAPVASLGTGWITDTAVASSGRVYVAQERMVDEETWETTPAVYALEAPGAPTAVQASASEWDPGTVVVRWQAPASSGGADPTSLDYEITVQDQTGGAPIVSRTFLTEAEVPGLQPGHTYDVSVTASNGAFRSAVASTTFTTGTPVPHPTAVKVSGKLAVGSRVAVANTGSWDTGTALTYAWYLGNGKLVSRAPTLVLASSHLGHRVRAVVTGTKDGFDAATVSSPLSVKVVAGTLVSRVPTVTGKAKVGSRLTAAPGTWTSGTALTYRWTADGRTITGATSRLLTLGRAQAGKRVRVVVTGRKAGYTTVSRTSAPTGVVRR